MSFNLDNKLATQHKLSLNDTLFFISHVKAIQERIKQIVDEQELEGAWTVTSDYNWLVKTQE